MATRLHRNQELTLGAGVCVLAVAGAVALNKWTLLLAPLIWLFVAWCSSIALPQRFVVLVAATVLVPRYPLALGVSADDVLPLAAALSGIVLLSRWGWPRLPRIIEGAFAAWLIGGIASALANGNTVGGVVKLAAPSVGRPVFWFIFMMTAAAIAGRLGLRTFIIPIAAVAVIQAVLSIAAYTRCTEIHLGQVSHPDNEAVWESRRPLGVEQGAGTNVGQQRIRCRATGTLGQSSNFLAAYLATSLPVVGAAALAASGRKRWLWAAGALAVAAAIVLTFTRASLIATVAGLVVTLLIAAPRRTITVVGAGLVLAVLASLAVPQVRTRFTEGESDRKALWYSGWLVFKDHPLFGVGYGNYTDVQRANPKYINTKFGEPTSTPHNGFIGIAAEGGALQAGAVLVLAGAIVVFGVRAGRAVRSGRDAATGGAAGGASGFLVQNMTNTLLLVPAVATYFWVLGGALCGAASQPAEQSGQLAAE